MNRSAWSTGFLARDPSAVYDQMDFKTRDLYRKAVEELAASTHQDENKVATEAVNIARQYIIDREARKDHSDSGYIPDRQAHVGYYLISTGRSALEFNLRGSPGYGTRLKTWVSDHTSLFYLGSIFIIAGLVLAILGGFLFRSIGSSWTAWVGTLVLIVPALTVAVSLVNWAATLLIPPQALPKLELEKTIPKNLQTMVVIPALLTSKEEVDSCSPARDLLLTESRSRFIFCDADRFW